MLARSASVSTRGPPAIAFWREKCRQLLRGYPRRASERRKFGQTHSCGPQVCQVIVSLFCSLLGRCCPDNRSPLTLVRTSDTTILGTLPNATKPLVGMVQAQVVLQVFQVFQELQA
jgi:hypothetical protein